MDFMNQIKNNSFINYYDSIYYSFLENKEENIIIINQNSYNPLNQFSNHIKNIIQNYISFKMKIYLII
jgi:thymidylate kinase